MKLSLMKPTLSLYFVLVFTWVQNLSAQDGYWQQRANYKMDVKFDVKNHQYTGTEIIEYTNNSPDTLKDAYFHLYMNAFQPGSMMDIRSRTIADADARVGSRISQLKPDEMGYLHVEELLMNDKKQSISEVETILEVDLSEPIAPGEKVVFQLKFKGQVPLQIRRNGRNSAEGVDYSMSQWYPKLSEYDNITGWNPNPYIGREFHGVWGDFDVKINIDSKYILAGSGILANADEIGYGYSDKVTSPKGKTATWNFKAYNVHDFVWAADTDYKHLVHKQHDGTVAHYFYIPGERTTENWEQLPVIIDSAFQWINKNYGKYPYPVYSFIQGGDGGMEYPMATLITGQRPLGSLVGVAVHELMHSWYQMILGTNESLYPWMDEGFTSFASAETMNHLRDIKMIPGTAVLNPFERDISGLANFMKSPYAEPISTHSDHYNTNSAYSVSAYTKGSICLVQLQYIVGKEAFSKAMLDYFEAWKFKHPTPNDFFRVFEKSTRLELDWFKEYWVNTTKIPDYKIDTIQSGKVKLSNVGKFPMPLDVMVTTKSGKKHLYYIPLVMMRGEKKPELTHDEYTKAPDWPWTNPEYELVIKEKLEDIETIEIDPSGRMIDGDTLNNKWPVPMGQP